MLMSCLCRFFFHLSLFFFSSSSFHLSLFFFSSSSFSFLFSSSSFHLLLFIFFFQLSLFIFFSFIFLFSAFIYQSSVFHGVLIDFIYISPPYGVFCLHCSPYPSFLCLRAVIDENLRFRGKKCCLQRHERERFTVIVDMRRFVLSRCKVTNNAARLQQLSVSSGASFNTRLCKWFAFR